MKKITCLLFLFVGVISFGQTRPDADWTKMGDNQDATFYEVQQDFNDYWRDREVERGKGYKPFKRWESFMEERVYPSGDMSLPSSLYPNYIKWERENYGMFGRSTSATSNWTELGPVGAATGPSPYTGTGAGRVNFVRFDPTDANTMFVGTPDGGLWKSTNSGASWTTNTDFLAVIGCSDLAIDPTNTQIMYLATGDLEGNRHSSGILKSTNGGTSWAATSLVIPQENYWTLSKLLMDPNDPLHMVVSSNVGVWYTTDGWVTNTYSNTSNGKPMKDMEYKPGDFNTIYASGTKFYKSSDAGLTWAEISAGLPTTDISRIALAVTAADPTYVYALYGKGNNSYKGVYRSTDSGASFSTMSTTPNLLGYAANGSDTGGQAFYDLSIVASPTDANNITTGGVNHWRSFDGGATWQNTSWWASGEIHADVHEIVYHPGSSTIMYSSNDGGFFKSIDNGDQWTDISANLAIGQVVKLGLSSNQASTIVAGEQDNGTILNTAAASWNGINGGDGGECFIDYTDNDIIYVQYVQGKYGRSIDGGVTVFNIQDGLPTGIDFYSPFKMHPTVRTTLYSGGTPTLYTSVNSGGNWTALGTSSGTGSIKEFVVAPSNPAIIYTVQNDAISKSTNSGTSFTNVTSNLPTAASLKSITVSNINPDKVWVTYSGYVGTDKVFKSINGGTSWTNISTGLPNLPINTIVFNNNGIADEVYVGGDIGVYIANNNTASWQAFMTNLPRSAVRDLEIYYPTMKLRAGTYGRGVWEADANTQTLGVNNFNGDDSSVLVSIDENDQLQIKSTQHNIDKVYVYDILGRKVLGIESINSTQFNDNTITSSKRVLFIKATLSNGDTIIKKIIF